MLPLLKREVLRFNRNGARPKTSPCMTWLLWDNKTGTPTLISGWSAPPRVIWCTCFLILLTKRRCAHLLQAGALSLDNMPRKGAELNSFRWDILRRSLPFHESLAAILFILRCIGTSQLTLPDSNSNSSGCHGSLRTRTSAPISPTNGPQHRSLRKRGKELHRFVFAHLDSIPRPCLMLREASAADAGGAITTPADDGREPHRAEGKGKRGPESDPDTGSRGRLKGLRPARKNSNHVHDAEEDNESIAAGKSKRRKKDSNGRYLGCPFYKRNPLRHMDCLLRNQLTETSFVVQHLERSHRQPIHCPLCSRVFNSRAECDGHIRLQSCCSVCGQEFATREEFTHHAQALSCEMRETRCEGMTDDEVIRLRVPRRHLNEPERWYNIWDIVFSDTPHPDSPYVSSVPEEIFKVRCNLCFLGQFPYVWADLVRFSDAPSPLSFVSTP